MGVYTNFETGVTQSVMTAVSSVQPVPSPNHCSLQQSLTGFGGQARVATAFGDVPIETLRVNDLLRTFSGRMASVRTVEKVCMDGDFFSKSASAFPILIPANEFGFGRPMKAITILPEQEISIDAHVVSSFKTADELCSKARTQRVKTSGLSYYRFHCGEPVIVRVEGLWVRIGH